MFEVNKGFPNPELLLNFVTRYHLAGTTGEQDQKLERLRRQLDRYGGFEQTFGIDIQFEDAEAK